MVRVSEDLKRGVQAENQEVDNLRLLRLKQPGFYFSSLLALLQVFSRRVALFALCFWKMHWLVEEIQKEADAATATAAAAQKHLQPK